MKKNEILIDLLNVIEVDRIKALPVSEKFKLKEFVKLIYIESEYAAVEGLRKLVDSPNYTINPTYNLFAMLTVNIGDYELIKEMIVNYAKTFSKSDYYYSQITITGVGLLMMEKSFTPKAIYHFLLSLLGDEFLISNLKTTGSVKDINPAELQLDSNIKYKPFEGRMRDIKYDMLALLKLKSENSFEYVKDIIRNQYGNKTLAFYLNMLDSNSEVITEYLYVEFMKVDSRESRVLVATAYALLKDKSILSRHYLFNSIIGKYSRFDKRKDEIEQDINDSMKKILEKVHE